MKRNDDVFFLTLVDFLLQVFFFGLLFFAFMQAVNKKKDDERAREEASQQALFKSAGVSSISELLDWLTKLAPLDQLRGTKDFIEKQGGIEQVKQAVAAASAAGGASQVAAMSTQIGLLQKRISQLEGYGKPSCLPMVSVNGQAQPQAIARVTVEDGFITMSESSPELLTVLGGLNLQLSQVQRLSLAEFRAKFAPLIVQKPECRYFLRMTRNTQLYDPVQTVWSAFRTL